MQSGKCENVKTPCVDTLFATQPVNVFKELADIQLRVFRILIEFFKENLIIV